MSGAQRMYRRIKWQRPAPIPTPGKVKFLDCPRSRCQWPEWEDGTPIAEKECCGAKVVPGKRYSAEHHKRATRAEDVE